MDPRPQAFFEELHARPDVLGLVLFGSYARGDHRPDSDIDLLVIVAEGETVRKIESRAGKTYEMVWTTESEALRYWQGDRDGCYWLWLDAQIIFDKDGSTDRLRMGASQILAEGKLELSASESLHRRFDLEDQLRAVKWLAGEDIPAANYALQQVASQLVTSYFAIERLWEPPPKKALQTIRATNPELGLLLDAFYAPQTPFEDSVALAEAIIQELFDE
jgi:hypothetical protein